MSKTQDKKIAEIKALLESTNTELVKKGIEELEHFSHPSLSKSLLVAFFNNHSIEVNQEILNLICSATDKAALEEVIQNLSQLQFTQAQRAQVLSTLWQTRHNLSEYLGTFVNIAIKGSYLEAIECFTIIENLEPPFKQEEIDSALQELTDNMTMRKFDKDHLNILKVIYELITEHSARL
ncbi:MAG: hypothetical protein ACXITV_06485 [Luteibaculaceae bacterium]